METQLKNTRITGFVSATLVAMLILVPGISAFSFPPESEFKILSENTGPDISGAAASSRTWHVIPEQKPDGTHLLKFFPYKTSDPSMPFCILKISLTGEIEWHEPGRKRKKSGAAGLLILPGYPAPCNILPIMQKESDRIYEQKKQAGGRVFVEKYRVTRKAVRFEDAEKNGWIGENIRKSGDLQMITVTGRQGRPAVIKQLWPVGGAWWIYEETSDRRSWLVY